MVHGTKDGKQLTDTEVILSPQKPVNITDEEFRGQTTAGKTQNLIRPVQFYQNKSTGEWDEQDFVASIIGDELVGTFIAGGAAPWSDALSAGYVPNSVILGFIDGLSNKKAKKEAEDDIKELRGTYPKPEDIMNALGKEGKEAIVPEYDQKMGGLANYISDLQKRQELMQIVMGKHIAKRKTRGLGLEELKYFDESFGGGLDALTYGMRYNKKPVEEIGINYLITKKIKGG